MRHYDMRVLRERPAAARATGGADRTVAYAIPRTAKNTSRGVENDDDDEK